MIMPTYGIAAYIQLVQQWADAVFPGACTREVFSFIWGALVHGLCGSDLQKHAAFAAEKGQLVQQGKDGYPPLRSLERRLRELEQAGIQEGFLAVAMRDATADLIARHCPTTLDQWTQLADQLVPTEMRFSQRGDQVAPSKVTYGPGLSL